MGPFRKVALWGLRLCVALFVVFTFFRSPGVTGYEKAEFGDLVYGRAHKPFVSRMLLPVTVRTIVTYAPASVRELFQSQVLETVIHPKLAVFLERDLKWDKTLLFEYAVTCCLLVVSLVGLSLVTEKLWNLFFISPSICAPAASLAIFFLLPPLFKYYSYIYDFPTLALYTGSFYFLARRQWPAYVLFFTLTSLSKETSILLCAIFVCYYARQFRVHFAKYGSLLCVQGIIYCLVRWLVAVRYHANPGGALEYHLWRNLKLFSLPYSMESLVGWAIVAGVVFYGWRDKPRLLQVGLYMLIPLVGLCFVFGYLDELRDYYEVLPMAVLLGGATVFRLLGCRVETAPGFRGETVGEGV